MSPRSCLPVVLAAAVAGCSSPAAVPQVRFANAPAVGAVDDRRDLPRHPKPRLILGRLLRTESYMDQVTRPLALPRPRRALGVNALDEVPDSTWFTNRIGVRDLLPDEIRRGSATAGSPEPYKPWTVHSSKAGGDPAAVGLIITDARGERFLLKFEQPGFPEIETAADAISSRLVWAAGYNVPEDHVVYMRPDELVLAPGAKIKDVFGDQRPLGRAELERRLAGVDHGADGRLRAIASRMLAGVAIGGHAARGVRADDPNDRIPHELRRDLRGAYALFSWLDSTDVKEDNTLDMWVADPADPRRHYVKHYLLDFGKSLGSTATVKRDPRRGHEYKFDIPRLFASFATLGLSQRDWERRADPKIRGVGMLEVETYDPGRWKPDSPAYVPFLVADDHDKLWGSKLAIRFTREQIRAAVEAGRFSDPRAVDFVTDTLVARQRAMARHWFRRVPPLDRFAVEGPDREGGGAESGRALCFDDLTIVHRLEPVAPSTTYTVAAYDRRGAALGAPLALRASLDGRTCAGPLTLSGGGDGYTIVRVDTARLGVTGTTYVHVARDPRSGAPRVIGIWRP